MQSFRLEFPYFFPRAGYLRNQDILVSDICPLKALIFTNVCTNNLTNKRREGSWELVSHKTNQESFTLHSPHVFSSFQTVLDEWRLSMILDRPVYAWTIVGAK